MANLYTGEYRTQPAGRMVHTQPFTVGVTQLASDTEQEQGHSFCNKYSNA
jgi:hypothetical protein